MSNLPRLGSINMWEHALLKIKLQGLSGCCRLLENKANVLPHLHIDVPLKIVLKALELQLQDWRKVLK